MPAFAYHPSTVMIKPGNTTVTYIAMLGSCRSEPSRTHINLDWPRVQQKDKIQNHVTHFGILQVGHSFSEYMILSYGYAEIYWETFSALTIPGSEKLVSTNSTRPTPTASMLIYLQEHIISKTFEEVGSKHHKQLTEINEIILKQYNTCELHPYNS